MKRLGLLALLGFFVGASFLSFSLLVASSFVRYDYLAGAFLSFLFPAALGFAGLGAAYEAREIEPAAASVSPGWFRAGGACALLLLALAYRLSSGSSGVLFLLALGSWNAVLGYIIARLIRLEASSGVSRAWAAHLLGLLGGYLLSIVLVEQVGAGAVVLALGVALLAGARAGGWVFPFLLVSAWLLPVDAKLESFRTGSPLVGAPGGVFGGATVFQAWSRHAHLKILREGRGLYAFRNSFFQWQLQEKPGDHFNFDFRKDLYSTRRAEDRALIAGIGGGSGFDAFPEGERSGALAVEIDTPFVKLLAKEHPEWNREAFSKNTVIGADARFVAETSERAFDWIVLESARFTPAQPGLQLGFRSTLYTREGLQAFVDRLAPEGLLLAYFNFVQEDGNSEFLPAVVRRSLESLGMEVSSFAFPATIGERVAILASPSKSRLDSARTTLGKAGRFRSPWRGEGAEGILTDDRPFLLWHLASQGERRKIVFLGVAAVVVLSIALFFVCRSWSLVLPVSDGAFFFLSGAGLVLFQLAAIAKAGAFFQDVVTTHVVFVATFLAWACVGSVLLPKTFPGKEGANRWIVASALLLAVGWGVFAAAGAIPSSFALRAILAAFVAAPVGFWGGGLLALGLSRIETKEIGLALAADALGVFAGGALFILIAPALGISKALIGGCILLFLAAFKVPVR